MIREIVAQAWAQSPAKVMAAVALAPLAVLIVWGLLVIAIIAGTPS